MNLPRLFVALAPIVALAVGCGGSAAPADTADAGDVLPVDASTAPDASAAPDARASTPDATARPDADVAGTDAGCPATHLVCGERCVDPYADPSACGGCEDACGAGEVCAWGTCAALAAELSAVAPSILTFPLSPCTLASERALVVDGTNTVYVAAECGPLAGELISPRGQLFVARSDDGGRTFSVGASPFDGQDSDAALLAVTGPGELIVLSRLSSGPAALALSHDGGRSWEPARTLAASDPYSRLELTVFQEDLWVATATQGATRLWHVGERGAGELTYGSFAASRCTSLGVDADTGRAVLALGLEDRVALVSSDDRGATLQRREVAAPCLNAHVLVRDRFVGVEEGTAVFERPLDGLGRELRAPVPTELDVMRGFAARPDGTAYAVAARRMFTSVESSVVLLSFPPGRSTPRQVTLDMTTAHPEGSSLTFAEVAPAPGAPWLVVAWTRDAQVTVEVRAEP